jgi:phage-related protein
VKLIRKLEALDRYSFDQLRHSKTVEHIKGKIWTLRYDLKNKMCRIYFKTDKRGTMQLLHLVIKKEWKLKPKDIEIAEQRAKTTT